VRRKNIRTSPPWTSLIPVEGLYRSMIGIRKDATESNRWKSRQNSRSHDSHATLCREIDSPVEVALAFHPKLNKPSQNPFTETVGGPLFPCVQRKKETFPKLSLGIRRRGASRTHLERLEYRRRRGSLSGLVGKRDK
jgi:hypothetical protein